MLYNLIKSSHIIQDVTKSSDYAGGVKTILSLISGIHVPQSEQPASNWDLFWDKLENSLLKKANCPCSSYEVD